MTTLAELRTVDDVREWFRSLLADGCSFHPDESFLDMVNRETGTPTFALEHAVALDNRMDRATAIARGAGRDVCEIALEAMSAYLAEPLAESEARKA